MNERWQRIAWTALLVQIPFELKYTLAGLSNLQWTFIALTALSITTLYRNREKLKADRVMQAAKAQFPFSAVPRSGRFGRRAAR